MTRDIGVLYVWLDQFIVYWLGFGDCLAYNLLCLTQLHHYIPYASLSLQQHLCTVAILVLVGLFITVAYLLFSTSFQVVSKVHWQIEVQERSHNISD